MGKPIPTAGYPSREAAVAALLAERLEKREIAARLNLSMQQVHNLVTAATSNPKDLCGRAGALKLKALIEAYWRERGYEIDVRIVGECYQPVMRSDRYDVRSNLVNGQPPVKANRKRIQRQAVAK